ncbi:hypothetical protein [Nonomuraea sp. NPDC049480]|uniref:hypothetical protein n=1 Tax=Nonomuraea sp. NPDC049480 TaxID=3364353 RepID=UPI0037B610CE
MLRQANLIVSVRQLNLVLHFLTELGADLLLGRSAADQRLSADAETPSPPDGRAPMMESAGRLDEPRTRGVMLTLTRRPG